MDRHKKILVLFAAVAVGAAGFGIAEPAGAETGGLTAAESLVASQADSSLKPLLAEVLQRNPKLARLEAEARASEQRTPQVKALPDPTASLTWFVMPPQTRVGPQRAAVSISQRLPWFGSLKFDEQAALWDAVASRSEVEAAKIELLTATRVDYAELQFLDREAQLAREDRATLEHYAELALARYASGVGIDQSVIKIQAEITRTDARLLEVAARRAAVVARINARRDHPQSTAVLVSDLGDPPSTDLDPEDLRRVALERRPEMAAARARIERAAARVEKSKKAYSPDLVVGLNYGYVSRRDDRAGQLNPPEDNGQDVLGISAGLSVPLWKNSLEAGVEEGSLHRLAAEERLREITSSIDAELGDLVHRIPLLEEQMRLYGDVLLVQARQSLNSAESAYAAGTVGALDLLDAERLLLSLRIAAERVRTDLVMARARLEGAIAGPLEVTR
jgi:outer membrane protein TolC